MAFLSRTKDWEGFQKLPTGDYVPLPLTNLDSRMHSLAAVCDIRGTYSLGARVRRLITSDPHECAPLPIILCGHVKKCETHRVSLVDSAAITRQSTLIPEQVEAHEP